MNKKSSLNWVPVGFRISILAQNCNTIFEFDIATEFYEYVFDGPHMNFYDLAGECRYINWDETSIRNIRSYRFR